MTLQEIQVLPSAAPLLLPLYTNFISEWEKKMNPLLLVLYASATAKQATNPKEAHAFLLNILEKISDKRSEAFVMASMETAHYKLILGQVEETKSVMDTCEKLVEEISGMDVRIHACFYKVCAEYYKV